MEKTFLKKAVKWGAILWLFGYVLGFLLFPFVPTGQLGWFITPVASVVTIWVLVKFIRSESLNDAVKTGAVWALMAIVLDFIFIVKLLNPEDGYYKFDVYLYYLLALTLPAIVFLYKKRGKTSISG